MSVQPGVALCPPGPCVHTPTHIFPLGGLIPIRKVLVTIPLSVKTPHRRRSLTYETSPLQAFDLICRILFAVDLESVCSARLKPRQGPGGFVFRWVPEAWHGAWHRFHNHLVRELA